MRYSAMVAMVLAYLVLLQTVPLTPQFAFLTLVVTVSVAVLALALVFRPDLVPAMLAPSSGPPADERRLRGSFRRQTHPDTAGRPMPRAPGAPAGVPVRFVPVRP